MLKFDSAEPIWYQDSEKSWRRTGDPRLHRFDAQSVFCKQHMEDVTGIGVCKPIVTDSKVQLRYWSFAILRWDEFQPDRWAPPPGFCRILVRNRFRWPWFSIDDFSELKQDIHIRPKVWEMYDFFSEIWVWWLLRWNFIFDSDMPNLCVMTAL